MKVVVASVASAFLLTPSLGFAPKQSPNMSSTKIGAGAEIEGKNL